MPAHCERNPTMTGHRIVHRDRGAEPVRWEAWEEIEFVSDVVVDDDVAHGA